MNDSDLTATRLQLLELGYRIIPTQGKKPLLPGWNTPDYLRELTDNLKRTASQRVRKWPSIYPHLMSTGIRLENGTGAVDIDVDHPLADQVMQRVETIAPEVYARAPTRFGGGSYKRALFVRIVAEGEAPLTRIASHRYRIPGDDAHHHCVEIFSGQPAKNGNCSRHMGVDGPHSYAEDKVTVLTHYRFDPLVPALWEVAPAELPVLTWKQAAAIVNAFDALAAEAGWERIEAPEPAGSGDAVYDITEDTRFDVQNGPDQVSYDELVDLQAGARDLRVSGSFIDGGSNRSRCWVTWSKRHDCVAVYDYAEAMMHYPAELVPEPDKIAEALKALQAEPAPAPAALPRPTDTDDIPNKSLWLLFSYGYCALTDSVVELYKPADDCQLRPPAFQRLYRAWREKIVGKKGGIKFAYATGYWEVNHGRVDLEGVRLRPDRPFPTYLEEGRTYKNTYLRPRHEGTGQIRPWLDFTTHLLPDPKERNWFCNWLAHKHLHPEVPGVAVVMVATGPQGPVYGAGRGILRDIVSRLLGSRYVKPIDFDVFTGKSAQGTYTDWGAFATLITVNEAKDTA